MTPKEKANELLYKYSLIPDSIKWTDDKDILKKAEEYNDKIGEPVEFFWHELARISAIKAVDFIIDSDPQKSHVLFNYSNGVTPLIYWKMVKKHLELL